MGARTIVGQRSGRLTVIDAGPYYEDTSRRQKRIVAICDCGDERRYDEYRFVSGGVKQCPPCSFNERAEKISNPESGWNLWFYGYQQNAKSRKIEFNLTVDEFKSICSQNCAYCGLKPQPRTARRHIIYANGVDRMNPDFGYFIGNVNPSCSECNRMKGTMTVEEFESHVDSIYKFKLKR
jgi:hypothetical protein